jgi:cell filamentation protein
MSDDPYVYPGSIVLRNKYGIRNANMLDKIEREIAAERINQGVPSGDFDLAHLKAIHRHLFQDIYDWAGDIRTVEISKGGSQFQFRQYIETGMADVHRRIEAAKYFKALTPSAFAERAGEIIGDVNYVHPFRDGNGRVQLQYLKQLGQRAGHPIDLTRLHAGPWIAASTEAHLGRYDAMAICIERALGAGSFITR